MKKLLITVLTAGLLLVSLTAFLPFGSAADSYKVTESGKYIFGVPERVNAASFNAAYSRTGYKLYNLSGNVATANDLVGTGFKVRYEGNVGDTVELQLVILGDIDGNGKVTTTDYIAVKTYFKALSQMNELKQKAADVDVDGQVSTVDYMRIKQHFAGKFNIYKNAVIPEEPDNSSEATSEAKEPWTSGWN